MKPSILNWDFLECYSQWEKVTGAWWGGRWWKTLLSFPANEQEEKECSQTGVVRNMFYSHALWFHPCPLSPTPHPKHICAQFTPPQLRWFSGICHICQWRAGLGHLKAEKILELLNRAIDNFPPLILEYLSNSFYYYLPTQDSFHQTTHSSLTHFHPLCCSVRPLLRKSLGLTIRFGSVRSQKGTGHSGNKVLGVNSI